MTEETLSEAVLRDFKAGKAMPTIAATRSISELYIEAVIRDALKRQAMP